MSAKIRPPGARLDVHYVAQLTTRLVFAAGSSAKVRRTAGSGGGRDSEMKQTQMKYRERLTHRVLNRCFKLMCGRSNTANDPKKCMQRYMGVPN